MTRNPVVVIGAGPAGIAAALAAAESAPTVLLDEQPIPGGHLRWWPGADGTSSEAMVTRLREAGVDSRPGTAVWGLFDGPMVAAIYSKRASSIDAGAVVIATGTVDRTWPVPGWQLDGVVTPREALAALREGGLTAGTRIGVVGGGADAEVVATALADAGAVVACREPNLASVRMEGGVRVERLRTGDDAANIDWVVMALERRPDPSLALLARADRAFLRDALIAMPLLAEDGATSLAGVFLAGEAAGITGNDAIRAHGERAGNAAAVVRGSRQSAELRVPALDAGPSLPVPRGPDIVICREQGVDLRTVQTALANGVHDVNDLRRRTRAGMGLAGGRETLPVLAALLLAHDPSIADERLIVRQRPPVRPLPFRVVIDEERAS